MADDLPSHLRPLYDVQGLGYGISPPPAYSPQEDLVELFDECYDSPLFFIRKVLRKEPRRWQREVCEEIERRLRAGERHIEVHIRAAHSSGKDWLCACLVLWWQATRAQGDGARTLTLAPTWRDVKQLLWAEIGALFAGSLLAEMRLGRMLDTEYKTGDTSDPRKPKWFATGASSDHAENLEGQHSPTAACRIIDEAKAVDDDVFIATAGLLFSEETLDVMISTPSTREGAFYRRDLQGGPELIRKVVTVEDLIADGIEAAVRWKKWALNEYGGEDNFEYQSRAMAEYIDDAEGSLFPFKWIERAMLTDEERVRKGLPVFHVHGLPLIGYDVAGSADGDENATAPVYGPDHLGRFEIGALRHWYERDTEISKSHVLEHVRELRAVGVRADMQGLGHGVCYSMRHEVEDRKLRLSIEEYRSADPPGDAERFLNRKAENAWSMRMAMEKDLLRLPNEPTLRRQLAAMKYEIKQGRIRVNDPDDSPDHFDAVLMGLGNAYAPLTMQDVSFGPADAPYDFKEASGWGNA